MLANLTKNTNGLTIDEQLPDHALAIYVHIPFCRTRCSYCAFNTYTGQTNRFATYTDAIIREIQMVAASTVRQRVRSIYFGGGTPSLMPVAAIHAIITTCRTAFDLDSGIEITLEANPGTVDRAYLDALRAAGVNRLSLGMQSAHAHELTLFARTHSLDDVRNAVTLARQAGFDSLSLDLIYGIPNQTLNQWRASLAACCALAPGHISLYSLSIEDATPLAHRIASGTLASPDPDRAADMYEFATAYLRQHSYTQYEISNWARPDHQSRHNIHVWRNLPYLGFGAGAHGYAAHTRYVNIPLPADYISRLATPPGDLVFPISPAADEITRLTQTDIIAETMIMELRLLQEGISYAAFEARFGRSLDSIYGAQIANLVARGLLEHTPDQRLRLTLRARLIANRVFVEFI